MRNKRTFWLVLALILIAGVVPIPRYLLDSGSDAHMVNIAALPTRNLLPFEQMAQAWAGLVIKPIYMMLSLVMILALIGQTATDLIALQWGQIAFLAGETFCAINFYIYRHESIVSEYLHSYGMALAFGFTFFALFEAFDSRILHLSSSKAACDALTVCGRCARQAGEGCKIRAIARFLIPTFGFLTFIPLLSPLQPEAYAVSIFGFPYSYTRFDIYEIYERRLLPLLALISFLIAYVPLLMKSNLPIVWVTKIFLCAGLGALGFSFFRLTLNAIFINHLVWFEFWEEATELMFVAATAFLLWQFKRTLLESTPILQGMGFDPKHFPANPSHERSRA